MSQTVQRAISILEFVSESPRSLTDVADHLDVHKSTALRLLRTLVDGGLVRRGPEGRYRVGYRMAGLAHLALDQFDLRSVAHDHLVALADLCGHTVHLAALEGEGIVYVDKVEPVGSVRLYSQIGKPVPLHTAAASKAILAYLSEERTARLLSRCGFDRFTTTTVTSAATLREQLVEVRRSGWAFDAGEFEDFVHCVAAPVRDSLGMVSAAVSITALKAKADLARLRELLPALRDTAVTISRELGWTS